eukprot:scaffold15117_cov121-Isochrysis_galbana.AAC.1
MSHVGREPRTRNGPPLCAFELGCQACPTHAKGTLPVDPPMSDQVGRTSRSAKFSEEKKSGRSSWTAVFGEGPYDNGVVGELIASCSSSAEHAPGFVQWQIFLARPFWHSPHRTWKKRYPLPGVGSVRGGQLVPASDKAGGWSQLCDISWHGLHRAAWSRPSHTDHKFLLAPLVLVLVASSSHHLGRSAALYCGARHHHRLRCESEGDGRSCQHRSPRVQSGSRGEMHRNWGRC